ncbi:hypothetical protein D1007_53233 [Hordeum vulgare]|nr:hypothetical protein D1007_53233 [Hordeum vulgare]
MATSSSNPSHRVIWKSRTTPARRTLKKLHLRLRPVRLRPRRTGRCQQLRDAVADVLLDELFNDYIADLGLPELDQIARQFMKGWGANLVRNLRERKRGLLESIQALDIRAVSSGMSPDEWLLHYDLEDQLSVIYANEVAFSR